MKLVSIIIPSYQHAKALRVCLGSVTQQSYDEVEVIVVDDGSTDETKEVVKMFDGVRYVYQENAGPQVARNRGFDESRGEFVIFCDADVVMQPGMIEKMVKALDGGDVAYVYSGFRFGRKVFGWVPALRTYEAAREVIFEKHGL